MRVPSAFVKSRVYLAGAGDCSPWCGDYLQSIRRLIKCCIEYFFPECFYLEMTGFLRSVYEFVFLTENVTNL